MPHAAAPRRRKLVSHLGDYSLSHFQMWTFCVFALEEGGSLGSFGISEIGRVIMYFPSNYYKIIIFQVIITRELCSRRVKGHSHRNALPLLPRGVWLPGKSQPGEAETN